MNRNFTLCRAASADLRQRMISKLKAVFGCNNKILHYIAINNSQSLPQYEGTTVENVLTYPETNLCYQVWLAMDVEDRHTVLAAFQELYSSLKLANYGNRKTLIFCTIFLLEFPALVGQEREWPD
ncbi:hypothetical protein DYU05_06515 [Mucilaginibacter terrenus]|uniref:Uncharacterized protein n=1 Tax=Mucilaginibacter terrenus TaxID=2482727 RepID=A0A3E2NW57_9SPHI|nr:hypothetical protein [Mucilaginibacter terrenus]RFZ85248.1 hypothetical protein DYU05_06515 [Mucilaginibacter terrenus]